MNIEFDKKVIRYTVHQQDNRPASDSPGTEGREPALGTGIFAVVLEHHALVGLIVARDSHLAPIVEWQQDAIIGTCDDSLNRSSVPSDGNRLPLDCWLSLVNRWNKCLSEIGNLLTIDGLAGCSVHDT